jgi:hypothetical protein
MRTTCSLAAAALVLGASLPVARADDKRECVQAFEDGQQLRIDGKLRAARDRLLVCSSQRCPALVRGDCVQWTTEVMAAIPTVVFAARDPQGHDVAAVRVLVDGVAAVERLNGEPVALDPGAHTFRFEPRPGAAVEQQAILRAGEKNREITVLVQSPPASGTPEVTPVVAPAPAPAPDLAAGPAASTPGRIPVLTWVFGGVGVAALGASLGLELSVKSDADGLRASCGAAGCSASQVDPLRTRQTLAAIGLGVGLVSLGASAVFFLVRPAAGHDAAQAASRVELLPIAHGAVGGVVGRF